VPAGYRKAGTDVVEMRRGKGSPMAIRRWRMGRRPRRGRGFVEGTIAVEEAQVAEAAEPRLAYEGGAEEALQLVGGRRRKILAMTSSIRSVSGGGAMVRARGGCEGSRISE